MENNSDKLKAAVVKYRAGENPLAAGVEAIKGLAGLKSGDRVLLKPNLVMWEDGFAFPRFGVLTTAVVIEAAVKLLKEYGCRNIAIGEGSFKSADHGSQTQEAFTGLGYDRLERRYGVKLIDFNEGPYQKINLENVELEFAVAALEADFIVNLPVLKTHNQIKVSLGFKNLKGCLSQKSRQFCHHRELSLDYFMSLLPEVIKPQLTIIDGIYMLARGPFVIGKAIRRNVLIMARDPWLADAVGVCQMGLPVGEIGHLAEYARRHFRDLSLKDLDLALDQVAPLTEPLPYDAEWLPDDRGPIAFEKRNIAGWHWPKFDQSICSGCSTLNNLALVLVIDAAGRSVYRDYEFLSGKARQARPGFEKTFLLGNCMIRANKNNPHIREAVPIKGCPPKTETVFQVLSEHGVNCDLDAYRAYRENIARRYQDNPDFEAGHFLIRQ